MLELNKISYQPATAEHLILDSVNLKAKVGQPVIIAGKSGSGKTSLIEIISGLTTHQQGQILWKNKQITKRQRRWLCGVVFQFPERYFLGLTVGQELRIGHRKLQGHVQGKALEKVGLTKVDLQQSPERLSGGQQRRLAVAVQLLRQPIPSILLLDEPTAGLDWSSKNEILQLIDNLSCEQIIIVVTHEPEMFRSLSKCSYRLINGNLNSI